MKRPPLGGPAGVWARAAATWAAHGGGPGQVKAGEGPGHQVEGVRYNPSGRDRARGRASLSKEASPFSPGTQFPACRKAQQLKTVEETCSLVY